MSATMTSAASQNPICRWTGMCSPVVRTCPPFPIELIGQLSAFHSTHEPTAPAAGSDVTHDAIDAVMGRPPARSEAVRLSLKVRCRALLLCVCGKDERTPLSMIQSQLFCLMVLGATLQ